MDLLILIFFLIGLYLIITYIKYLFDKRKHVGIAKEYYHRALASGDVDEAIKYGKLYYKLLRNGNITVADEKQIAQDINSLK